MMCMGDDGLKPCPFCGGEAKTSQGTTDPENKFQFGWIGCQKCRCFINYVNNNRGLKEATAAWNRRVPQTVVNQHGSNCTHISNCGTLNLNL